MSDQKSMESCMPQRTAEHERLSAFVGEWKTREVHQPTPWLPQGGTGEGRSVTRWGVNNLCTIVDYKSQGVMGTFEGHGVETWDPNRKAYVTTWFDSMMPVGMQMIGRFEGDDYVSHSEFDTPEGKCKMRSIAKWKSKDEYTFSMAMDMGGKWVDTMTITYVRA